MPARAAETSFIAPDYLYTYEGFVRCSGISKARIYEARRAGCVLPRLKVGKRLFVRGYDGIAFIERLAELGDS